MSSFVIHFCRKKTHFPEALTSYDFLKTLAVLLMIVDHMGYYFFPEDLTFRLWGRLCVPIWFFLIGYARSRDIGPDLWIGGTILWLSSIALEEYVLPLNILFTMLAIRMTLRSGFVEKMLTKHNAFWTANIMLAVLIIPSSYFLEYGTLGWIMAVCGYLVRNREEIPSNMKGILEYHFLFALVIFFFFQSVLFVVTEPFQQYFLGGGLLFVLAVLYKYKPATYPELTKKVPSFVRGFFYFGGRWTLEIYVAHLLIFKTIALFVVADTSPFVGWSLSLFHG